MTAAPFALALLAGNVGCPSRELIEVREPESGSADARVTVDATTGDALLVDRLSVDQRAVDSAVADTAIADALVMDAGSSDHASSDATLSDHNDTGTEFDAAAGDAIRADTIAADATRVDSATSDAATFPDTRIPDGASVDSGPCIDQCSRGQSQCTSTTTWQVCGQYDGDTCLDWGPARTCPAGSTCSAGACRLSCTNGCPVRGAQRCNAGGTAVEQCADVDNERCLEWSSIASCAGSCTLATCGAASCNNECRSNGSRRCTSNGTGFQTCSDSDADGCLEWSAATACGPGEGCANGVCSASPGAECESAGQTRCDPATGGVQTCFSDAGRLRWGDAVPCAGSDLCTWGACRNGCVDECLAGEKRCSAIDRFERCDQYDGDGCLEWPVIASTTSCWSGESCVAGLCTSDAAAGYHQQPFFWDGESLAYELYFPASYVTGSSDVGLILTLHGSCEAGDREAIGAAQWDRQAESLGILVVNAHGPLFISSTAGLTAPAPTARCWEIGPQSVVDEQATYLLALLDEVVAQQRVDPAKLMAFGFSGGGYIACHLAMFYSATVRGAGLNSSECNYRNTDPGYIAQQIPFDFVIGDQDWMFSTWVVPEYNNLTAAGYRTRLTTVVGASHTYFSDRMAGMWEYLTTP